MNTTTNYFYCACQAGRSANEAFRDYFRLYRNNTDGIPRLVEQGLADKIPDWEKKYNATFSTVNPYPTLD